jgi:hypothetical protein
MVAVGSMAAAPDMAAARSTPAAVVMAAAASTAAAVDTAAGMAAAIIKPIGLPAGLEFKRAPAGKRRLPKSE